MYHRFVCAKRLWYVSLGGWDTYVRGWVWHFDRNSFVCVRERECVYECVCFVFHHQVTV